MSRTPPSLPARLWADRAIYIFLLPTLLLVGAFTVYPIIASIGYSFQNWNGFATTGTYIGFDNYRELWQDRLFWNAFGNTMVFLLIAVPLRVGAALLIAIVLNARFPGVRLFRTGIFLPVVTTAAIVGVVMRYILDPTGGPVNIALMQTGAIEAPINFLGNAGLALYSAVGIWVWKWLGITVIYWLAALQTIPTDLYEAAELDGANAWQKFTGVTFPMLIPFTIIITLITLIEATNVFDLILTLTGGGPFYGTEVIDIFVYRNAFINTVPRLGYASAAAILFGLIVSLATVLQVLAIRRFRRSAAEAT
ncbi:sugar ABC transporter permease [Rhodophyticola sp. CCM32]|uniref:carbohydrate ABC transporter permease n=1 Tax=Rhodophyticola sp. CCM32 TaxID=2916397 RepID=UPI00107F276E|nr:sugar ABC transporter permease [Rhodophyticola sp. CCM32]QBY01265.1 sugar ABC transporter permease [Rhodophyticola sp. CCM32]